jgi:predicted nucleotidyltransferase
VSVLRRVDLDRREDIYRELQRFVARLRAELSVERVYLFGSFARGDIHEGSDIDLIIIGDFIERFQERIFRVLELNDENLPIEPLCYSPDELEAMIQEGNPFILEVLNTGREL